MRPLRVSVVICSALALLMPGASAQAAQRAGPDAAISWVAHYNGPANGVDEAVAIGVSPDATKVFVTGQSLGQGTGMDYATAAYDSVSGVELWVTRYDPGGSPSNSDTASALAVSADGTLVFVTGQSYINHHAAWATFAYEASTGARVWGGQYQSYYSAPVGLAVAGDGAKVFATGSSYIGYQTVAWDALTGKRLWVSVFGGEGFGAADEALGASPDGKAVYVTGYQYNGGDDQIDTVAYSALNGNPIWHATYDAPGNDVPASLAVSPDGSKVYITARSARFGLYDYVTLAYDALTGSQLWMARYNGPATGDDLPKAVAASPDGATVFVTGASEGQGTDTDATTLAYDAATGAQLWVASYDGQGGPDSGESLAVSPDGTHVYVSGATPGSGTDYLVLSYEALTGMQAWVLTYDGPAHGVDSANDIVAGPDGSQVYITGSSRGIGTSLDYATIAAPA